LHVKINTIHVTFYKNRVYLRFGYNDKPIERSESQSLSKE